MNCAFVASYFGPYYSNFVASMLAFHDGMRAKGHDVCYVLPKEAESFEWIGLLKNKASKIYYLKYEGTSLNNIFALRRIFRIENIDLIECISKTVRQLTIVSKNYGQSCLMNVLKNNND